MADHRHIPTERQHHVAEEIASSRSLRRALLLGPVALALSAAAAGAQQQRTPQQQQRPPNAQKRKHWLVGEWEGDMVGLPPVSKGGTRRILRVIGVAPGGKVGKAVLVVPAAGINADVTLTIDGEKVTFATQGVNGITHDLERRGDSLEGTWDLRGLGKTGALRLERKQ